MFSLIDQSYQCDINGGDKFFPKGVAIPSMNEVNLLKRGSGFTITPLPDDVPLHKTKRQLPKNSKGPRIDRIKHSFDCMDPKVQIPIIFAVLGGEDELQPSLGMFLMPPIQDAGVYWFWNVPKDDIRNLLKRFKNGLTLSDYKVLATKAKDDGRSFTPRVVSSEKLVNGPVSYTHLTLPTIA